MRIELPLSVEKSGMIYRTTSSKAKGSWALLVCGQQQICRFCGIKLGARNPSLNILGHLTGIWYYYKNSKFVQKEGSSKCIKAHHVAVERAKQDLQAYITPKTTSAMTKIQLPSLQTFAQTPQTRLTQSTVSWADQKVLLTKATILIAQKCLPFSVFDSIEF